MSKNILLKKYNGSDWDVLHPITKAKNVVNSAGGSVQDHIGAGGAAHANATAAEAGFMSAEDKAAIDAATSAATASTLAKRDAAGRIKAAAPAASDDVARKSETDAATAAAATANSAAAAAQAKADAALPSSSYTAADVVNKVKAIPVATAAINVDQIDGKHAAAALLTNEKTDLAGAINEVFTSASNGKGLIAGSITAKGVPASGSDPYATLASKITSIPLATGNAVASDVLASKTFSTPNGTGIPGTMPDRGAVVITPGASNQAVAAGYHNGSGVVVGSVNLSAGNVKSGINLFGVVGNVIQATGTAPASSVYIGHTASNANGPITGTMPDSSTHITPSAANQVIPAGYHNGTGVVYGDPDLKPENIIAGANIFGIQGSARPIRHITGEDTSIVTDNGYCGFSKELDFEPIAWGCIATPPNYDGTIGANFYKGIYEVNNFVTNLRSQLVGWNGYFVKGKNNTWICVATAFVGKVLRDITYKVRWYAIG